MEEREVGDQDRPLYPPKLLKADVLYNPFDDLVPRRRGGSAKPSQEGPKQVTNQTASKSGKIRNSSLLSFGDEAFGEETSAVKLRSSHDVLDDPRLRKEPVPIVPTSRVSASSRGDAVSSKAARPSGPSKSSIASHKIIERESDEEDEDEPVVQPPSKTALLQKEIEEMKNSLLRKRKNESEENAEKPAKSASLLEEQRKKYATKAHKKPGSEERQREIAAYMRKFEEKLDAPAPETGTIHEEGGAKKEVCRLHSLEDCKSCRDAFGEIEKEDDSGWWAHSLVCDKQPKAIDPMTRVDTDSLLVIDPRIERLKKQFQDSTLKK